MPTKDELKPFQMPGESYLDWLYRTAKIALGEGTTIRLDPEETIEGIEEYLNTRPRCDECFYFHDHKPYFCSGLEIFVAQDFHCAKFERRED